MEIFNELPDGEIKEMVITIFHEFDNVDPEFSPEITVWSYLIKKIKIFHEYLIEDLTINTCNESIKNRRTVFLNEDDYTPEINDDFVNNIQSGTNTSNGIANFGNREYLNTFAEMYNAKRYFRKNAPELHQALIDLERLSRTAFST